MAEPEHRESEQVSTRLRLSPSEDKQIQKLVAMGFYMNEVADLERKACPECKMVHYSSLFRDTCLGCTCILDEEKRLGRRMTRQERIRFLKKIGF